VASPTGPPRQQLGNPAASGMSASSNFDRISVDSVDSDALLGEAIVAKRMSGEPGFF